MNELGATGARAHTARLMWVSAIMTLSGKHTRVC